MTDDLELKPSASPQSSQSAAVLVFRNWERVLLGTVTLLFLAAVLLWWHLDHRYPSWDAANHVLDSIKYAQLMAHAKLLRPSWWHDFLTVSFNYPMTPHLISGAFRCLFGYGLASDCLVSALYSVVLSLSFYFYVRLLTDDTAAALMAVIVLQSYPLVVFLSHLQMLDYGCISMFSLALCGLLLWRRERTARAALFASIALSLGVTSKQGASIFFVVPLSIVLWDLIKKKLQFRQALIVAILPALAMALWLIPNADSLLAWRNYYYSQTGASNSFAATFVEHLISYCSLIPAMMSLPLFVTAIGGFIILVFNRYKLTALLEASGIALVTLIGFSCLAMNNPESRYILPILILPAMVSGLALSRLMKMGLFGRLVSALTLVLALTILVVCNFSPYPLKLYEPVESCFAVLRADVNKAWAPAIDRCPTRDGDIWGQDWVVAETLKAGNAVRLNVLPSTDGISVHSLELCAKLHRADMDISTFRKYTLNGDQVSFDQDAIAYYNWYLLKTGDQGFKLCDKASQLNYDRIVAAVRDSGRFIEAGRKPLIDGSVLILYRAR